MTHLLMNCFGYCIWRRLTYTISVRTIHSLWAVQNASHGTIRGCSFFLWVLSANYIYYVIILVHNKCLLPFFCFTDFPMFFREAFIGSLPMAPGITFDVLNGQLAPILNNFVMDLRTANASQLIEVISNTIATSAGQLVSGGNATVAACVGDFIRDNINRTDVEDLVKGLTTVQRAVNTLDRIASFLYRYRMTTQFRFPRNCVRRFIELNFCARCTKRTPPLCSNTCGALFRGCLSPYDTVLSRQLDVLWNVSRQVLRITNSTLDSLFMNERSLLNIIQVVSVVS